MTSKHPVYVGIFLDEASREALLEAASTQLVLHETVYAHHVTLAFGESMKRTAFNIGAQAEVGVLGFYGNDRVQAAHVDSVLSLNRFPHVTLATHDAKPFESNEMLTRTLSGRTMSAPYLEDVKFKLKGRIGIYMSNGEVLYKVPPARKGTA